MACKAAQAQMTIEKSVPQEDDRDKQFHLKVPEVPDEDGATHVQHKPVTMVQSAPQETRHRRLKTQITYSNVFDGNHFL